MSLRTIKRRRLECKTDYKLRFGLLKSSLQRIVIRRTNKYYIIQIVESSEAQDKVIFGATSKDLLRYGWDEKFSGSLKSIPAGYLIGYLVAKEIKNGKFILDLGMMINKKGGRTFAVAAGLVDGGLDISASKEVFPKENSIIGENAKEGLKKMIEKIKQKIDAEVVGKPEKKSKDKIKKETKK